MKLVMEVESCRDCPCKYEYQDMGMRFHVCHHDNRPEEGHMQSIEPYIQYSAVPDFCPINDLQNLED